MIHVVLAALVPILSSMWLIGDTAVESEQLPILIDGEFHDWEGIDPIATFPTGPNPGNEVRFENLWVESNSEEVLIRFDTSRETLLTNSNPEFGGADIRLLIDGDANTSTGFSQQGLGTELTLEFGRRSMFLNPLGGGSSQRPTFHQAGITMGPTHTDTQFEVRIPRTLPATAGGQWQSGDRIRLVLREEDSGSRLPPTGFIEVELSNDPPVPIAPRNLARAPGTTVRVLNHNTEFAGPLERPNEFRRILNAMEPDIITWQEMWDDDFQSIPTSAVTNWLNANYPSPTGIWYVASAFDLTTASPWPITAQHSFFRVLATRINTPADISPNGLVIFNAHTSCCDTGNNNRDSQHDRISATWRNMLNGTGPFTINPNAPAIMTGDYNMVGWKRQLITLRDGVLIDNTEFGPNFSPARSAGSMSIAPLRHSHTRSTYTWRRLNSSFAPGRLDWYFYTGDAMELLNSFILDTPTIPFAVRQELGLQANDTTTAADHLPMIADFRFTAATQ